MAVTFTNTEGTGWEQVQSASTQTSGLTVTLPTESDDGDLHLVFYMVDDDQSAQTLTVSNITGESTDDATGNTTCTLLTGSWSSGAPSSVDVNTSSSPFESKQTLIVALNGAESVAEVVTSTGNGTTVTYPASTVTAESGDMIFRACTWGNVSHAVTASGNPGTLLKNVSPPASGNVGLLVAFENGAGSTASADTSTTLSVADNWIGVTVIISQQAGNPWYYYAQG